MPALPPPTPKQIRGDQLYADDFTSLQLEQFFQEAAPHYSASGAASLAPANYGYRELNRQALLRHIPAGRRFDHALGFGCGYGTELAPLAGQIDRLTIIEAGYKYGLDPALTMPTEILAAVPSGDIPLEDQSVDLVTCFGALSYVANVSHVIGEFARVLARGGLLLLREPITNMGLGRTQRGVGLSAHVRGVPRDYLHRRMVANGFAIERETLVGFIAIASLWSLPGPVVPYNSRMLTALDRAFCRLLGSRVRYHAVNRRQKIRPSELAILARRA